MSEADTGDVNSSLPRAQRTSVLAERYDLAVVWMTATLVGAVAISVVPQDRKFLRVMAPLIVMALYGAVALSRGKFSTHKVADSVYFTGFLWTLWALIDLLIIGDNKLAANDLYIAFGYALTTTAFGMFGRLSILQFFRTVDEQEDQAVDSIDERVRRVVAELDSSQLAIVNLRNIAAEELSRWNEQFATQAQSHLSTMATVTVGFEAEGNRLTESIRGIRGSVAATERTFADAQKRLSVSTTKVSEQLSLATDALEATIRNLGVRVSAIEVPGDLLTRPMSVVLADLRAAISPVKELATETLGQLRLSIDEVARTLKHLPRAPELEDAVKGAIAQLSVASTSCRQLGVDAAAVARALAAVSETVGQTAHVIDGQGNKFVTKILEAERGLNAARDSIAALDVDTRRTSATLKDVVTFVNRELRNQ